MKKIIVIALTLVSITGCSFLKDVNKHCKVSDVAGDINTASFSACLKCDSLAKIVRENIDKARKK